jgi:hypothetical protein
MNEDVWNGCDNEAQESMLQQLRDGVRRRMDALDQFGGDHW